MDLLPAAAALQSKPSVFSVFQHILLQRRHDILGFPFIHITAQGTSKGKLPSVKELSDEYGKVLAKKKAAYSEYKEVRKNMQTYQTAKYDIDKILGIEKTPDQQKTREQTR